MSMIGQSVGRLARLATPLYVGMLVTAAWGVAAKRPGQLPVKATQNTQRLMPYQVFELTFEHLGRYRDPTWDVTIEVSFTAPSGKKVRVGGFFYGSSQAQKPVLRGKPGTRDYRCVWPCDPADLWKARFAPAELGHWTFAYTFRTPDGGAASGSGRFEVVRGRVHQKGFVRKSPHNPFRFVFDDGTPYFPMGLQDCIFDANHNESILDAMSMEGPFRLDQAERRPAPPPGALFARGNSCACFRTWRVAWTGRSSRLP